MVIENIIEVFVELLYRAIDFTMKNIFNITLNKTDDKRINVIERDMLKDSRRPLYFKDMGYSVNYKKNIPFNALEIINTLVLGASQFGKTNFIITRLNYLMYSKVPFMLIDPKADNRLIEQLQDLADYHGVELAIFTHRKNVKGSVYWNSLKVGDASTISSRIFNSLEWSEIYYTNKCRTAIKFIVKKRLSRNLTVDLPSFYNDLKILERDKETCNSLGFEPDQIDGLTTQIHNILESPYGEVLKEVPGKTLNFWDAWQSGKMVIIDLSFMKYEEEIASINKMLVAELKFCIGEQYEKRSLESEHLEKPFHSIFDEIADVYTPDILDIFNKGLSAKMACTAIFQTDSDIKKYDHNVLESLKINAHEWFIFNQSTESASSAYGDSIGTEQTEKHTKQTVDGEEADRGSVREVLGLMAHPDVIKRLNVGQCIYRRNKPFQVHLLNTKHLSPRKARDLIDNKRSLDTETNNIKDVSVKDVVTNKKPITTSGNLPVSTDGLF